MRNGITLITSFNRNILKFILILILTAFIGHGCDNNHYDSPTRPNNCYVENPWPSENVDGILKSSYWITNKCDLDTLSGYTKVVGNLTIRSNSLTSLKGIESLTSVGGILAISDNAILTNLEGIEGLTSVGGALEIIGNADLTSLEGLENLTSVGKGIYIQDNNTLASLKGLENLTSVNQMYITVNNSLTSLHGLENLTSVGKGIYIQDNNTLASLEGLENLTSVSENLSIFENIALTSLVALENLSSVGELNIQHNDSLTSLELNKLNHVGISFIILRNQELCTSLVEDLKAQVEAGKGIGDYELIYDNKPDC